MMKKIGTTCLALAVIVIGAFSIVGCSTLREVDSDAFVALSEKFKIIHTMESTSLIGVSGARAYIQQWRAPMLFGSGITVYWTSVEDLPVDYLCNYETWQHGECIRCKKK